MFYNLLIRMLSSTKGPAEKYTSADEITARNIIAFKQLSDIAAVFQKHRISFMPLKGIALLESAYKNVSGRYFCDIDLLVHSKDLRRIDRILAESGYTPTLDEPMNYSSDSGLLPVDLHTDVWYMTSQELKDLWANAEKAVISGTHCFVMPKEEMIIYQAAHSTVHHGYLDETAKKDLYKMIESWHTAIDYSRLIYKLRNYNLLYPFMRLFETVKYSLNEDARFNIESLIKYVLAEPNNFFYDMLIKSRSPLKGHLMIFILQRNIYRKAVFMLKAIFPPPFFIARRYNKTSFLGILGAYLYRPFSFIWSTLSVLLRGVYPVSEKSSEN